MRMAITIVMGKSPQPYEAPVVIVGLFFTFTYVILRGPNKLSNLNLNLNKKNTAPLITMMLGKSFGL